jgi:hypothetical protein
VHEISEGLNLVEAGLSSREMLFVQHKTWDTRFLTRLFRLFVSKTQFFIQSAAKVYNFHSIISIWTMITRSSH